MDKKRIRELIDACRPGSEDLADDAMQELNDACKTDTNIRKLYEQTQADDEAIRSALHGVNVPDGLANRLLERLVSDVDLGQNSVPANIEDDSQVQVVSQSTVVEVNSYRGWTRRRWLAAAALACSAAIGGIVVVPRLLIPPLTANELNRMALDSIDSLDETWNLDLSAAPERLPISNQLSAQPSGWQTWQTPRPLNETSVAYRLFSPLARGRAAVLFVAERPSRLQDLNTTPPNKPLTNTGGQASGVWRENDRLYVLVVPGGKQHYQRCLRNQQLASIY